MRSAKSRRSWASLNSFRRLCTSAWSASSPGDSAAGGSSGPRRIHHAHNANTPPSTMCVTACRPSDEEAANPAAIRLMAARPRAIGCQIRRLKIMAVRAILARGHGAASVRPALLADIVGEDKVARPVEHVGTVFAPPLGGPGVSPREEIHGLEGVHRVPAVQTDAAADQVHEPLPPDAG